MAMTIEQEREAFEKWMSEAHPSYPLTSHEGRYVLTSVRNLWAAFSSGCAHITQPAQAVDVGAIEPVIRELRKWPKEETLYDHRATRLECADKLTRALSGEKAGPVGDDLSMYECEGCGERPGKPHSAGCWTRIATTSTTPGKEGA